MNFWENLKQDLKGRGPILDEGQYAGPQPSGELSITEAGPGALSDPNFQEDDGRKPLPKYEQRHLWTLQSSGPPSKYRTRYRPKTKKVQKPVRRRETPEERMERGRAYLEKERWNSTFKRETRQEIKKKSEPVKLSDEDNVAFMFAVSIFVFVLFFLLLQGAHDKRMMSDVSTKTCSGIMYRC